MMREKSHFRISGPDNVCTVVLARLWRLNCKLQLRRGEEIEQAVQFPTIRRLFILVVTRLDRETPHTICTTGQKTTKSGETQPRKRGGAGQYYRKLLGGCRTWQQSAKPGHDSRDGQRPCFASEHSLALGKGRRPARYPQAR